MSDFDLHGARWLDIRNSWLPFSTKHCDALREQMIQLGKADVPGYWVDGSPFDPRIHISEVIDRIGDRAQGVMTAFSILIGLITLRIPSEMLSQHEAVFLLALVLFTASIICFVRCVFISHDQASWVGDYQTSLRYGIELMIIRSRSYHLGVLSGALSIVTMLILLFITRGTYG